MFAIAYQHIVKSENRSLTFVNPRFEKVARERGFYSEELMKKVAEHGTVREITEVPEDVRKVFGTAHEIEPIWHVKMQAAFQKYTDNAVSKTINLRNDATVADVMAAYKMAWETDCRGITIFRDGCKGEQVLNLGTKSQTPSTNNPTSPAATLGASQTQAEKVEPVVKPRPVKVEGATYCIETPLGHAFITVNHDEDGNPFEVFVTIGKAGSEVAAMAEALGRLISTTLRFGNHMPAKERAKELMEQLQGIGGGRSVGFGPNKVKSLPDAVAKAIGMHFGLLGYHQSSNNQAPSTNNQLTINVDEKATTNGHSQMPLFKKRTDLCPKCGEATFVFEEGCKKCYGCGYSEC